MDEVWRRRICKRSATVRAVKSSPQYAACLTRTPTPDPCDRSVSKRRWEAGVASWRRALREQARPIDWLGGPEEKNRLEDSLG